MVEIKDPLPAWFTERMMNDTWSFGLLMCDGTIICIEAIDAINQAANGTIWLDVCLKDSSVTACWPENFNKKFVAPTSRLKASINASHVMAAFEMADT